MSSASINTSARSVARIRVELSPKKPAPIAAPLFELAGAAEHAAKAARKKSDRRPAAVVSVGSIKLPIWRCGDGRYFLTWYEGRTRKTTRRADLEEAKELARQKAQAMANGETYAASLSGKDRATFTRVLELLQPSGKSPEVAIAEYVEALGILPAGTSLIEAARFLKSNQPAALAPKKVAEMVEEFLTAKLKDGIGKRWHDSLKSMFKHFTERFTGPMHVIRAHELDTWLDSLKGGPRNRSNHRAAVLELAVWARTRKNYLPKTWEEIDELPGMDNEDAEIKVLTPEQVTKLLAHSPAGLIPFVALTAFAGIRNCEMGGEKKLLDWSDIDFDRKEIIVPKAVGKTGKMKGDRSVPMQPNLVAWLLPYAKPNGPVCELDDPSYYLTAAKRNAGIPADRNQTRNTLRKSYISYRLSITKNIAQVADESGNSIAKIKSNYKRIVKESEAKRWFNIWPTSAEILQLEFGKNLK